MKLWRQLCLIIALGAGLVGMGGGAPILAQTAPTLTSLEVEIWPEFDRPSALVIVHGILPATASVPAAITWRIPAAAQLNATAYDAAAGGLLMAANTVTAAGPWQSVAFTVEALNFRLEYYDPALTIAGEARTLALQLPLDYAAQALTVRIQEPVDARNLTVDPAFELLGTRDFGLNYYGKDYGAVPAGAPLALTLNYDKASATLSQAVVAAAQPTQAVSIDTTAPIAGAVDWTPWLVGLGGLAGLALMGAAGWYVWQRNGAREPAGRPRPRKRGAPTNAAAGRFCTQCGQPLRAEDAFCRQCGTPTR